MWYPTGTTTYLPVLDPFAAHQLPGRGVWLLGLVPECLLPRHWVRSQCFLGTWKPLLFCFSQMPCSSALWDCTLNSASQQSTQLHTTALNQTTRWQENLHTRKCKRETHSFWNSSCLLLSWLNLSFLSINLEEKNVMFYLNVHSFQFSEIKFLRAHHFCRLIWRCRGPESKHTSSQGVCTRLLTPFAHFKTKFKFSALKFFHGFRGAGSLNQ